MSVKVNFVSTWDGRGAAKAQKGMKGLSASAVYMKLKVAAAATALFKLGKVSLRAAAEDQKAQAILANNLRNLGWGKATAEVEAYIDATQRATGIADDQLRPAFSRLMQSTKDVYASQGLLNQALDISAGTGKDLDTVISSLQKAFAGQRRGLMSLGTGIDAATLKTASMADILAQLDARFTGSSAAAASSYAGQLARIKIIGGEATETLGKSFFDALGTSETAMTDFGNAINSVAGFLGTVVGKVAGFISTTINGLGRVRDYFMKDPLFRWILERLGYKGNRGATGASTIGDYNMGRTPSTAQKQQTAVEKYLSSIKTTQVKTEKKVTGEKEKQLRLAKLAAKFDLELIGIAAAKRRTNNLGTLNRLNALEVIAQSAAGLPVSESALRNAEKAMNVTVQVNAGSIISEGELLQKINETIQGQVRRTGGGLGRYSTVAL